MRELETQQGETEIGRCRICGQTFATEEHLWMHLMQLHGRNDLAMAPPDELRPKGESA
jgi:hypothetical protein